MNYDNVCYLCGNAYMLDVNSATTLTVADDFTLKPARYVDIIHDAAFHRKWQIIQPNDSKIRDIKDIDHPEYLMFAIDEPNIHMAYIPQYDNRIFTKAILSEIWYTNPQPKWNLVFLKFIRETALSIVTLKDCTKFDLITAFESKYLNYGMKTPIDGSIYTSPDKFLAPIFEKLNLE